MQKSIESVVMDNKVNGIWRYIELIKKLQWVNVCLNWYTDKPQVTGESGINMVVNRTNTSAQIIVGQRVSRYFVGSLIGAMILEPLSKKSWSAMNKKKTPDNHGMLEQI